MNEKSAHLELDVKDFGPIAKAKMELRPLTVFVGPRNLCESYVAILVYALPRFFPGVRVMDEVSRYFGASKTRR